MNDHNKEQQLRYLEEVCIPLHRAGFETQPLDESQLPVHWNGAPLCRITGKGSVFYRREDVDTPLAEDALLRVEDIAARTMEYMTAKQEEVIRSVQQQIGVCVPDLNERIRQQEETLEQASQEQTM